MTQMTIPDTFMVEGKIEGAKGSYILSYSRVVYTVQSIKTHRDY